MGVRTYLKMIYFDKLGVIMSITRNVWWFESCNMTICFGSFPTNARPTTMCIYVSNHSNYFAAKLLEKNFDSLFQQSCNRQHHYSILDEKCFRKFAWPYARKDKIQHLSGCNRVDWVMDCTVYSAIIIRKQGDLPKHIL